MENATVRSKSEINPNKKDYFCAQWKNHGQSEIEVVYELEVNPTNPEGDFLRRNVVFRVDQDSPKTIQVLRKISKFAQKFRFSLRRTEFCSKC